MPSTASVRAAAVARELRDRGFVLEDEGWATVAREGPAALAGVDAPLAVVELPDVRPLTVVSAVANAAHEGRVPVLVAADHAHEALEALLSEPFLLAGREEGARRFVPVEDRIRLSDDSYACVGTGGELEWFETPEGATDEPPLVLAAGGETVAVLDSVEGLACPGPSVATFRYSYARGGDGRFRVFENGEELGRYPGVGAMRADGFRPAPLPLVPEHHVRDHGRLARATVVASVTDGRTVSYRSIGSN